MPECFRTHLAQPAISRRTHETPAGHSDDKPEKLSKLLLELATYRAGLEPLVDSAMRRAENVSLTPDLLVEATAIVEDFSFDLDFQDADWSFWNSIE